MNTFRIKKAVPNFSHATGCVHNTFSHGKPIFSGSSSKQLRGVEAKQKNQPKTYPLKSFSKTPAPEQALSPTDNLRPCSLKILVSGGSFYYQGENFFENLGLKISASFNYSNQLVTL